MVVVVIMLTRVERTELVKLGTLQAVGSTVTSHKWVAVFAE